MPPNDRREPPVPANRKPDDQSSLTRHGHGLHLPVGMLRGPLDFGVNLDSCKLGPTPTLGPPPSGAPVFPSTASAPPTPEVPPEAPAVVGPPPSVAQIHAVRFHHPQSGGGVTLGYTVERSAHTTTLRVAGAFRNPKNPHNPARECELLAERLGAKPDEGQHLILVMPRIPGGVRSKESCRALVQVNGPEIARMLPQFPHFWLKAEQGRVQGPEAEGQVNTRPQLEPGPMLPPLLGDAILGMLARHREAVAKEIYGPHYPRGPRP